MIEIVNGLSATSISDSTTPSAASSSAQNASSPFGTPGPAATGGGDPIGQIEAILNAHLGSLQWIDGAVKELEGKVKEVEAQHSRQQQGGGSHLGGGGGRDDRWDSGESLSESTASGGGGFGNSYGLGMGGSRRGYGLGR